MFCVLEGIADRVIEMIEGAARELVLGNPTELTTDVGPVIDREAFDNLQNHLQRLRSTSKVLVAHKERAPTAINLIASNKPASPVLPNTVAPAAFELASLAEVKDEIFGPLLQIVRWGSDGLKSPEAVIEQINALGYGLTLGIQTRIDSRAQALADAAHVGNIYVNRNMILETAVDRFLPLARPHGH